MKYTCTIEINLPINEVVKLWSNTAYFNQWQDGFQSIKLISGRPGTIGAKSKILLQHGKRKMELLETIISNKLPTEKKALYEHLHMTNTQSSQFESINESKTRYISKVEYTKFNGVLPKLMSIFFSGVFKKQSQKWMNQFKYFAENHS
jgi:uncharacterized membrane protein